MESEVMDTSSSTLAAYTNTSLPVVTGNATVLLSQHTSHHEEYVLPTSEPQSPRPSEASGIMAAGEQEVLEGVQLHDGPPASKHRKVMDLQPRRSTRERKPAKFGVPIIPPEAKGDPKKK